MSEQEFLVFLAAIEVLVAAVYRVGTFVFIHCVITVFAAGILGLVMLNRRERDRD